MVTVPVPAAVVCHAMPFVNVCVEASENVATKLNCCVPFTAIVAVAGLTAIEESVMFGAVVPVPVSETVCGLPEAEELMVKTPFGKDAAVPGAKVTAVTQDAPGCKTVGQLLVWE